VLNRDVYLKDPDENRLLNNGVASVAEMHSDEQLRTLRYELKTFVCTGEYKQGLVRILDTYLRNLDQPEQPGVWVSGFFGSGKSHLVKVLRALWTDFLFPDGATARGLVELPTEVTDLLMELSNQGRRHGGLHAASGTLGSGGGDSLRQAFLGILFRSADLPEPYQVARFVIWLKQQGYFERVKNLVEQWGRDWRREVHELFVSPFIARALQEVYPDFARDEKEAHLLLRTQYCLGSDVTDSQLIDAVEDALSQAGALPLTLVALDEVQQWIGERQDRSTAAQELAETCCKSFGARVLLVATGQTALSGTPLLNRLHGRFPVSIELTDTDVDEVTRKVILEKRPDRRSDIERVFSDNLGEISKHLASTTIGHRAEDIAAFVADYPLLPVRRRFWERVLRAVDQPGTTGQLRSQMKIVHEVARQTADLQLGTVVRGDFLFDQLAPLMLQTGVLPRDIYASIQGLRKDEPEGELKARLCGLIFLIGKLPRDPGADLGMRATADVLADLLVVDLEAGSGQLRKHIPSLLEQLEASGLVISVGGEYRLQTRESSVWTDEYRRQLTRVKADPRRIDIERATRLRVECEKRLKMRITQGDTKEHRNVLVHYGADLPKEALRALVVWLRDGWEEDESSVLADVRRAGNESPAVFVYISKHSAEDFKETLAALLAASATLEAKSSAPDTPEAREARAAIQGREGEAQKRLETLIDDILAQARVFKAGGQQVVDTLANAVRKCAEDAVVRLYPKFDAADHVGWARVVEQAQGGSESALEAVGYQGDVDKHPVSVAILQFVASGKKGDEIRTNLESSPYGWPRDAIDGALYTLLASGHIRALDADRKPVDAKSLRRSAIAKTQFRAESTMVSAQQRIDLRGLMQALEINCKPSEELAAVPELLRKLSACAAAAGGVPPRPKLPDTTLLDRLGALAGNEQLVAIHEHRTTLIEYGRTWARAAETIITRMPRWDSLRQLVDYARPIPEAAPLAQQVDAILTSRLLLADPDPAPTLCEQLCELLRQALTSAWNSYKLAHGAGMQMLDADENWRQLTPAQRLELLQAEGLLTIPDICTGTEKDILELLRLGSLPAWSDRTAALPKRFHDARLRAAKLIEPAATHIRIPRRTLKTTADVEIWLAELEGIVTGNLKRGPVVVD